MISAAAPALAAASPSVGDQCTPTKNFSLPGQLDTECPSKQLNIGGHMGDECTPPPSKQVITTTPRQQRNGGSMNGGTVKSEAILSDEGSTYSNDIIYQC